MRVFDAKKHNGRLPFRHSLAATLYGDALRPGLPLAPEMEAALGYLLERGQELSGAIPQASKSRRRQIS